MGNAFTTKTYLESKLGSSLSLLYSTLSRSMSHTYFSFSLVNRLKGMDHKDFLSLLSKYKFVFATENAVCEDYITEKLWRSFYVGTVPIIYGSPTIKVKQTTITFCDSFQWYSDTSRGMVEWVGDRYIQQQVSHPNLVDLWPGFDQLDG